MWSRICSSSKHSRDRILTDTAVSILTRLCFELEQIRDHIYSSKIVHFFSKSGLGFAAAQRIAELIAAKVHVGVR